MKKRKNIKIPNFYIMKKCSLYHRFGNIIQSLVLIAENLIILLTFGFIYPNWSWKWIMSRLHSKFYDNPTSDKKKSQ